MEKRTKIVAIVDDRFLLSVGRDVVSFGVLIGVVWVGIWLDSSALQWIAGILWILFMLGKAMNMDSKSKMTISEARKYLDKLEANS